ncbi:MAG: pyruvate kinase [Clostridiaceae bacterium]|nr:pyruvate kinase [Clostridiaceae bacterium]
MEKLNKRVSTGIAGLDQAIDHLRLGDNVVWQVDSISDYLEMVRPYVEQARRDRRDLIYVRFGDHPPLFEDVSDIRIVPLNPEKGFEFFATGLHHIIREAGVRAFYVFDCLTDLLRYWHSDLMIGNFFKVTCPYLFELDTLAYFAITRNAHTFSTVAGIRETTQLLLDLYRVKDKLYVHPLKVWERYSPTMFLPHRIQGDEAVCITASSEAVELFGNIVRSGDRPDYWHDALRKADEALADSKEDQVEVRMLLMRMLIGSDSRILSLCERYFSLGDLVDVASRVIGTGLIGGKSVGMLLARAILKRESRDRLNFVMESHDSFYLGADIFYTYIVANGWWRLRIRQKTGEGYYQYAPELREKLLRGTFPKDIREQFYQLLEHFGQSPIIVRSSSLLEDNFGNAFAGKYESVFCANQGTPEERYEAFEQAVRSIYASTMNEDALEYRMNRGLFDRDEQMAILVQRVSGDRHGEYFFPHVAGVGNSSNLYVWDPDIDMTAGMLRLVCGLGTRAVDRSGSDYARIVTLDRPERMSPMEHEDRKLYSQHKADVISFRENALTDVHLDLLFNGEIKADPDLFGSIDYDTIRRYRERGIAYRGTPRIFDFRKLLEETDFPSSMREMLSILSETYQYPVDIEFTANFTDDGAYAVNLLQCRPLQTRGLGHSTEKSKTDRKDIIFESRGHFMGGNTHLEIEYVIYIETSAYSALSEREKYEIAREIGVLNTRMDGKKVILIGPGRWGTTTPSLGVPVRFSEINRMTAICEVSSPEEGFVPELSYGSHFFQDLVETGIFYAAIFDGREGVLFQPGIIRSRENILGSMIPGAEKYIDVIHVIETKGMLLHSDILSQMVFCG